MNTQAKIRLLGCPALLLIAANVLAQSPVGPQAPARTPQIIRIPTQPEPDKPPVAPEEIISHFAALEDQYGHIREGYTYRKTVRLEEIGADGKPSGAAVVVTDLEITSDGTVRPKAAKQPDSTLHYSGLDPDALEVLSQIPSFPLAAEQLAKYDIAYQTSEAVDELNTYVFRVTPKEVDRTHPYFSGLIWVDDHDLAIVKSYGKWVTEMGDVTLPRLPFNMFETYRQPVANKYWLPAYTRSDGVIAGPGGSQVPVRLTILWDNYTPIPQSKPAASADEPH